MASMSVVMRVATVLLAVAVLVQLALLMAVVVLLLLLWLWGGRGVGLLVLVALLSRPPDVTCIMIHLSILSPRLRTRRHPQ
jgi:hypothetical protein